MRRTGRGLGLSLGVLFAVLSGLIVQEIAVTAPGWNDHADELPVRPPAERAATASPAVSLASQHAEWTRQVLSRPLFSPDRRPEGTPEPALAGLPRLSGIIIQADRRIAIFMPRDGELSSRKSIVAEAGSAVGAFRLVSVAASTVTLSGPAGTVVLTPSFDTLVRATPQPALPGPAELLAPAAR